MHDDDRTGEGVRARRAWLGAMGALGCAVCLPARVRAQGRPACIARPAQTAGPFFIDTGLARSDIRSDASSGAIEPGLELRLEFRVSPMDGSVCQRLPQARVEVWHCNARGLYSGVREPHADLRGRNGLRGYQYTDGAGAARFTTVYPGWYPGRVVHLHFSISIIRGGRREAFTSQLYFDDVLSDQVLARAPDAERPGPRVRNDADFLFLRGGTQLLLATRERGGRMEAIFDLGLQVAEGRA